MSDLDIGMNDWVVPRLKWDDAYQPDRGRVLSLEEIEKLPKFQRYTGEDENSGRGAHAARRASQRRVLHARLRPQQVRRLHRNSGRVPGSDGPPAEKAQGRGEVRSRARSSNAAPAPRSASSPSAAAIRPCARRWICWRSAASSPISCASADFPFDAAVESFLAEHDFCFVVEQNRDAQLRSLLTLETSVPKDKLRSVLVYGGFPLSAHHVVDGVLTVRLQPTCVPNWPASEVQMEE